MQRHGSRTSSLRRAGAVAGPGRSARRAVVILPRDAHKSAVHGLVLSGATPSFLSPRRHDGSGLSLGIGEADLREELARHGDEVGQVLGDRESQRKAQRTFLRQAHEDSFVASLE